ncbi:MAG TPA: hypothetical protein VFI58_04505 [Xanthobacteraceae bacterium]|jgi:hypothetical protein|nr:hypothetical protein [Xanthobacteraceae bacterium]
MPITPFLKSEKFDSQTSRVMGVAWEMPCLALPTGDCANDVKHAIANTIIVLTKAGERNPGASANGASAGLRNSKTRGGAGETFWK